MTGQGVHIQTSQPAGATFNPTAHPGSGAQPSVPAPVPVPTGEASEIRAPAMPAIMASSAHTAALAGGKFALIETAWLWIELL